MALLMIFYPLTRWPIESLRGDETAVFAGMTLSQNISVGLLLMGLALWARLSRCPAGRHADIALPAGEQALPATSRPRGPGRLVAGLERAR
jgi:phosphatidylglycerol:prolipoprotein diacylglycerol transferase